MLRIIAGEWRGRRLPVPDAPGLRPTGDRIRETLFNWLASELRGARCLDLYAGSGALGIEALSRGADYCDFVDRGRTVATNLRQQLRTLGAGERARVHCADAETFLRGCDRHYDLVFLDPPFAGDHLAQVSQSLQGQRVLSSRALIYVEQDARREAELPTTWEALRDKRAGEVHYSLYAAAPTPSPGDSPGDD